MYRFRSAGYSVDYLVDFSVTTDLKNSSRRILDLDQPGLGMSREYLIKGLDDEDVQVRRLGSASKNDSFFPLVLLLSWHLQRSMARGGVAARVRRHNFSQPTTGGVADR